MQGVDVVHHNVALVPLTKSGRVFWDVNVTGSINAAELAVRAGVKSFVHMSSSAIYGCPVEQPITERTPTKPVEIYGRGKLAGEEAVRRILARTGVSLVVIRPRTILGEGRLGIFQILFQWIRENRNVYTIGDGNNLFQFIHAHDLMDFYMLAVESGRPGAYNVGTDRYGTLREGLERLIVYAGSASRVKSLPVALSIGALRTLDVVGLSPLAPWHYLTYHKPFHFDVAPLLAMGWKPQYSNDEMFQQSYDWFLAHAAELGEHRDGSAHRKPVKEALLAVLKYFS
jgi:nucleoside-diphosphate-sugar epimerase